MKLKHKSSKHSATNTFKFQTFSERLSGIHVDVARKVRQFSVAPEDTDTFFGEALLKWSDLNCTQHFLDFRKEIVSEIQSLAQLLHFKDDVVSALKTHLKVPHSLAYQPLLDLVTQLARDLQSDFYPYFPDFFHVLVDILNVHHHNVEILEQAFSCLAYMFKFLWRTMLKDINNIYVLFSPLLESDYQDYINNFAAESFAFLIRKCKTTEELFHFVFKQLSENPSQCHGVGRLIYESLRGVQKQLHSGANKILETCLRSLSNENLPQDEVVDSLLSTWKLLAGYTSLEHSTIIWQAMLAEVENTHNQCMTCKKKDQWNQSLEHVLKLVHVFVKHKDGCQIGSNGDKLIKLLQVLVEQNSMPDSGKSLLLDICSDLLLANSASILPQNRISLIEKIYESQFPDELICDFSRKLFTSPTFEREGIASFLNYCNEQIVKGESSERQYFVLAELVNLKAPSPQDARQVEGFVPYNMNFSQCCSRPETEGVLAKMYKLLEEFSKDPALEKAALTWASLVILPHLKSLDNARFFQVVHQIISVLFEKAQEEADTKRRETWLCVWSEALVSMLVMKDKENFFREHEVSQIATALKEFSGNVHVLRAGALYFSYAHSCPMEGEVLTEELFLSVFDHLRSNLSSPYSRIRLLTLQICCQFPLPMPALPNNSAIEQIGVFRICLSSEEIPTTVHTYRDQLIHIRKLDYSVIQNQTPVGPFQTVALRYLLGLLYHNFTLLWKPLEELIATHAYGLESNVFWDVYGPALSNAATLTEEMRSKNNADADQSFDNSQVDFPGIDDAGALFVKACNCLADEKERPDHANHRYLLWEAMAGFADACQARSRHFVPLVFRFLENEYYQNDASFAPMQDISVKESKMETTPQEEEDEEEVVEDEDMDVDHVVTRSQAKKLSEDTDRHKSDEPEKMDESEEKEKPEEVAPSEKKNNSGKNTPKKKGRRKSKVAEDAVDADTTLEDANDVSETKPKKRKHGRAPNKTLVIHLTLFAKMSNPMALFMEPKLRSLYFSLLLHRDASLQKVAFECLLTYKFKYLMPYRENFERLMDDKTFKEEIVLFTIDPQHTVVVDEHRQDLMPILMRLLYGKMMTKTGKDSSGKSQGQFRRNIVLRFLAGCHAEELRVFLDLVFEPFASYASDDVCATITNMKEKMDLSSVIPLRKFLGVLGTLEIILMKMGHLLNPHLSWLLQMLLGMLATSNHLLDNRENIHPPAVNVLKSIRQNAFKQLNKLFGRYRHHNWTKDDIEAVFTAAVWPQLEKLPNEGLYHPTGLLRLMRIWSQFPRYWVLLGKLPSKESEVREPLYYACQLLHGKNVNRNVVQMILDMLENLLRNEEELQIDAEGDDGVANEAESALPLDAGNTITMDKVDAGEVPLNIGLVLGHIPVILDYIRSVVSSASKEKGKSKMLPANDLNILARISLYVTDSDRSGEIILLILPFLATNSARTQTSELSVLESICNLLKLVEKPSDYLLPMAKLFSALTKRESRTALCEALKMIGKRDEEWKESVKAIVKLNVYDRRMMDEPDYAVRLEGYKEAENLIAQKGAKPMFLLLVHNCCYFITNVDDMSLRDSSSLCLQNIMKKIASMNGAEQRSLFNEIILQNLLPEVKSGLRNLSESARHEYVGILAQLIRYFPKHPVFAGLLKLTDADIELDFFINITHIQLHRRGRALKRLAKQLKLLKLGSDVLMEYLLPLVSVFLKDEAYFKNSNLIDSVVETIGGICQVLPWARYLGVLRYYLNTLPKATNQKLMIRIAVCILDNFSFDLQNSQLFETAPPGAVEVEKPKKAEETEAEVVQEEVAMEVEEGRNEEEEDSGIDDTDSLLHQQLENEMILKKKICGPGLATRIHQCIINVVIPQLHKCLTQKAKSDSEHKMAKTGKYAEDEEILRIPIAIAMVKLLQNLPNKTLQNNLPGILLKVCDFMKSRATSIRDSARGTLLKILQSLGPSYFSYVLRELRATLKRGYQLHVLSFTVFTLLNTLLPTLKPGDLDTCIRSLTEVFNEELFGAVSEEKDVQGIIAKLPEARKSKGYDSYGILAKYVSHSTLATLVAPVIKVLETSSHKVAKKANDVLQKISHGLVENPGLEIKVILTFTYGLSNEALPMLNMIKPKEEPKKAAPDPRLQRRDTFIIEPELPRGGKKAKPGKNTNSHLIVEFGLNVLLLLLKRSTLLSTNAEHLGMLDPFVDTLVGCLQAKHGKVTTTALRCLMWLLKFPLPSMEKHIKSVTSSLFVLLQTYASPGAAKGDNVELVTICFKAVTTLVRDVEYHTIDKDQLHILLTFAEQDMHDYNRQGNAFGLLRAILSRRLVAPEIHDIIGKVEELSITAPSPHVRLQSRQVVQQFMLDYPLQGSKLENHLEFYLTNLEYEQESGRESALEMMATVFTSFPQGLVTKYAEYFFMPLASTMVNDDSPKCRELAALAIKSLLGKLDSNNRDKIFSICVEWMNDKKVKIRWLGALANIQIVGVESSKFERHLSTILPIIENQTSPEKYEQIKDESETALRNHDHLLFSLLKLFFKILTECNIIKSPKWTSNLSSIWGNVETHLLHGYSWVRLASAQLFGLLFSSWTPEELVDENEKLQEKEEKQEDFLLDDLNLRMYSLCGAFCKQFATPELDKELADQVLRNLVFLGKVLGKQERSETAEEENNNEDESEMQEESEVQEEEKQKVAKLHWLITRLSKQAKLEAASNPKCSVKRCSLYKWLAAISVSLEKDCLLKHLPVILAPLVQQLTSNAAVPDEGGARQLAQEVVDLLKSSVGVEVFTQHYVSQQKDLMEKKTERKKTKALLAVSRPEVAARKKIKKNLQKQAAKKRKLEEYRPSKKIKKMKRK